MQGTFWKGFAAGLGVMALGAVTLVSMLGFQGASTKVGSVDVVGVQQGSDYTRQVGETLNAERNRRTDILKFVDTYRSMKREDALRFRDLSLKATLTDAEKTELDRIKNAALESDKRFNDLVQKTNPTPDELKAIEEFRNRQATTGDLLRTWQQEFQQELNQIQNRTLADVGKRVLGAIRDLGKKQGYSVIYDAQVAPYTANDVTEAVIKELNSKK